MSSTSAEIIEITRRWLENAVIGLNLCPFAKGVHVKGQIRYVVSRAANTNELLDDLERELRCLTDADPEQVDTTLLIIPDVLHGFDDFADFLDLAEVVLRTHGLQGVLQVASFHPDYVFDDAAADDMANYTNRSPYPILHLLREASLSRATAAFPDAAMIYDRNIATLRALGHDRWAALIPNVAAPARKKTDEPND